ncbi:MAG: NADP-dependent isocitrate dehydrogenase [Actinobacteria bacterium]|nr:NADP-dependent isocitrate dehydrogenase [Actinomycetota bacterium]
MSESTIIYTHTDEAPALATYSLLPIVSAFAAQAGVTVTTSDISLAGRLIANFAEFLDPEQRITDDLATLGKEVLLPEANIIKLPNISASIPQIKSVIAELQSQGFAIPNYPDSPETDVERDIQNRYKKVSGSAVNPVLREGNSDRRAPLSVKKYAQKHPHSMGKWSADSKTNVAHMAHGDFFSNEVSSVMPSDDSLSIALISADGSSTPLRGPLAVLAGEIIDATKMEAAALDAFLQEQISRAQSEGVLFSIHLKATMMKVSDPIIFGHVVRAFFPKTFSQFGSEMANAGLNPNNGLAGIYAGLDALTNGEAIKASFASELADGPALAMVDSDKGITNLHAPNDVIVDASMPAMIRSSGHMWNAAGQESDTLAVLPDASYAGIYQVALNDCRRFGAFDPATMGSVPNVGLMAQAAEEYGSHDKTFEIPHDGTVVVTNAAGETVFSMAVAQHDIFRMCQTKDVPVADWVKLAVNRARLTGDPAIFWLDEDRAHDAQVIAKVRRYLADHDTTNLQIDIMAPAEAIGISLDRIRKGLNTISVTGNVLRDYLTDLFPIMELGTSAKMLSIVPLINGGGLFETGAGGSAPKHVQQFEQENYLRWDSLGEFLALASSFEYLAQRTGNARAQVLADTLDRATGRFLDADRSPGRKLGTIDNRGSHIYLAIYWADELAQQTADVELASKFADIAAQLAESEEKIVQELIAVQGSPVNLGGYFRPNVDKAAAAMRPSPTFNRILASL